MGIRLERFGLDSSSPGTFYHDELKNRELPDSHPIKAITGLEETLAELREDIEESSTQLGIIQVADTKSVDLNFDLSSKTLIGNVKAVGLVSDANENAIEIINNTLHVDKLNGSETIEIKDAINSSLNFAQLTDLNIGERFSLRLSWNNNNAGYDPYSIHHYQAVENGSVWRTWVETTNGPKVWLESDDCHGVMMGILTKERHNDFNITMSVDNGDYHVSNMGGFVIAYKNVNGVPHMLIGVLDFWRKSYAVYYNCSLINRTCLFERRLPELNQNAKYYWPDIGRFYFSVNKKGSLIACSFSIYDNVTLPTASFTFDLNDYSWGQHLINDVQIGIISEADGLLFRLHNFSIDKKSIHAIISPDANNALVKKDNGLYVQNWVKLQAANSDTIAHSIVDDMLTSKVRIATTTNNELEVLDDGLYVPRIYDSDTIINSTTLNTNDQIDLKDVYDYGIRFSLPVESDTNNLANDIHRYPSIESSWVWDEANKSFKQLINQTGSFNGFISDKIIPSDYKATIRLISTDGDDDCNGVVLAYKNVNGVHHMLTAYVYPYNGMIRVAYNIGLTGRAILYSKDAKKESWNNINCYRVEINKTGVNIRLNFYRVASDLTESLTAIFSIDLLQYSFTEHFINDFSFGFCNESQANSYYQILEFDYTSEAKSLEVKIDPAVDNLIEVTKDGLYIPRSSIALKTGNTDTIVHTVANDMLTSDVKMSTMFDNEIEVIDDGLYLSRIYNSNTIKRLGDTITLRETFDSGIRFSLLATNSTNTPANDIHIYSYIEDYWIWDKDCNSFRMPAKVGFLSGFISDKIIHSDYKATIRLISRVTVDTERGNNGVVLAYKEINGIHHMLTACLHIDENRIKIVYNASLPGKVVLYDESSSLKYWNGIDCYRLEIEKINARIAIKFYLVERGNFKEYYLGDTIINLNDYPFGELLINDFSFGFCNEKQKESYYQIVDFDYLTDYKAFDARIDPALDNRLEATENGLYVPDFTVPLSKEKDNMIVTKTDGIYVPTYKDSQTIEQDLTKGVPLDIVLNGIMNGTTNSPLTTPSTYNINGANPFLYPEYSFKIDDIYGIDEVVTSNLAFGLKYELIFDIILTSGGAFTIELLRTKYYIVGLYLYQWNGNPSRLYVQQIVDGKPDRIFIIQEHRVNYNHSQLFRITITRDNSYFYIIAGGWTYKGDIAECEYVLDKGTSISPIGFSGSHTFHIGFVKLVDPTLMTYDNKMHVKVSAQVGNQLQIVDDGLCVPAPPEEVIYTQEDLQAAADEILGG